MRLMRSVGVKSAVLAALGVAAMAESVFWRQVLGRKMGWVGEEVR